MRVDFKPYLYSYQSNFQGNKSYETTDENNLGTLIHETCFFRESKTDDFIKGYILKNFSNEPKIKIVNGACSTGEETYTQAMLLSDMKDKVEIEGFDISPKAIAEAQMGKFTIYNMQNSAAWQISYAYHDSFLVKNFGTLTNKENEQKELFTKFFNPLTHQVYVHKNQDFQANDEIKSMCQFKVGDVKNLSEMYDKNSVHVLTFKNALYHLVCGKTSSKKRFMISGAQEIIENLAREAHSVLKPNGLFVFGAREGSQGIDTKMVYNTMLKCGFEPAIELSKNQKKMKNCSVWKKVSKN